MKLRVIVIILATFFLFLLAVGYITYPLLFHMGDMVTGYGDELVIAWIQNWAIHALTTNPLSIFNANIYYPYQNTYAYSDLFLTSSILSVVPVAFIGQPIAAFNFTFISSLLLDGVCIFLLCYYLTKNYLASLLGGMLFIFAPVVLDKKVHVQVLALQWIPLSVLAFLYFVKSRQTRYLVFCMLFFVLQTYNSFMPGYFLIFFYVVYLLYFWFRGRRLVKRLVSKKNIAVVVVGFALLIPIVIPYLQVSRQFNYVRDIRDAIHFAIQPEDLVYPNEHTRLQPFLLAFSDARNYSPQAELHPGYLGFVFSVLCVIALVYFIKSYRKKYHLFQVFVIAAFVGLLLSLGPFLHFGRVTIHKPFPIPLPYAVLYYIAPGFAGFRNSARWEMMFVLFVAVAVVLMLVSVLRKSPVVWQRSIYLLLMLGVIVEYNYPMKFMPVIQSNDFPKVFSWLSTTSKESAVIILPIYNWNAANAPEEIRRQYFSTVAFRSMVNGASGFSPPPWQELVASLNDNFPNSKSIAMIKNMGVDYIIFDEDSHDKDYEAKRAGIAGEAVAKALRTSSLLRLINKFGNYYVFAF